VLDFPALRRYGALAAVSTRVGGVSEGPYQSLNQSVGVGDEAKHVAENRRRFLAGLGLDGMRLVLARQVHGDHVAVVAEDPPERFPDTDGLLTTRRDVALGIFVADCVPVFLVAPDIGAVALLHSGWRGTLKGIGAKAVAMLTALGTSPERIWAALGPGAGPGCYEVGADVRDPFLARYPWADRYLSAGRFLDLLGVNRELLERAGVPGEQILGGEVCTICHPSLFFSYRRDGQTSGRMLAVVARF
jgi:YfiH family protein